MKRYKILKFSLLLLFVMLISSISAQVRQVGKVMELNSGGKAISGVGINVISSSDVQPAVSDSDGVFILNFGEKKAGEAITFRVSKPDYEVVNADILNGKWLLTENDTLDIVLAKIGKIDEAKALYYGIIDQYQLNKYQKAIDELKENMRREEITIEEYNQRIFMAEEALKNATEQIASYADRFARINKDDMDSISRKAFETLDKGDIEGAIKIFEDAKFLEQLKNKIAAREDLVSAINNLIPALKEEVQLRLLVSGNGNRKIAGDILEQIALADTNDYFNIREFIYFLDEENEIDKAVYYCNMALRKANLIPLVSDTYYILGRVVLRNKDYEDAEKYLLKAVEVLDSLPPKSIFTRLFMSNYPLHTLSILYLESNNLEKAVEYTNKALEVRKELYELDSTMLGEYANTLATTGRIYYICNEYDKAKSIYLKSIEMEQKLVKTDPVRFLPILAGFKNDLGTVYCKLNDIDSAYITYSESIDIWEKQMKYIVDAYYKGRYIQTMQNFGIVNEKLEKYDTAELYYKKAIAVSKEAGQRNPNIYNDLTANSLNTMGDFCQKMNRIEESIEYYLEALSIYEEMDLKFNKYKNEEATLNLKIGDACRAMNQKDTARKHYEEALKIYKELKSEDRVKYSGKVKETKLKIKNLQEV